MAAVLSVAITINCFFLLNQWITLTIRQSKQRNEPYKRNAMFPVRSIGVLYELWLPQHLSD
jgi:hypothetical protein